MRVTEWLALALAALATAGCARMVVVGDAGNDGFTAPDDRPASDGPACTRCGATCVDLSIDHANCGACGRVCSDVQACVMGRCITPALDVLLVVDNSNSMRENQTNLLAQFQTMLATLTSPPCVSPANTTPHTCDPADPEDTPQYTGFGSIHVGVVSTDLGTPGSSVPGCANSDLGDDGRLNPIRYGQAMSHHEPWNGAPPTFGRPADCTDPNQFPAFISYTSGTTNVGQFTHDFQCNAGLFVNGCALESPLEAAYRALIVHDARSVPGNTSPNAGFLRDEALLSIIVITDEEDGSVRDCRFARGAPCEGDGAIDVYNTASTAWSAYELNLRFYMYQPCGPQDPTWRLERYIDPGNPGAGFLSLKPGHPEWVMFSAIAGVPLEIPMLSSREIDWDALLGRPGANREDFCQRDTSRLGTVMSAEGPISMRPATPDPNCSQRTIPACRREGTTYNPSACTTDAQNFAWPARRIVEVARRFDQSPLCHGQPCHNGGIVSVCGVNYAAALRMALYRSLNRN